MRARNMTDLQGSFSQGNASLIHQWKKLISDLRQEQIPPATLQVLKTFWMNCRHILRFLPARVVLLKRFSTC